MKIALDNFEQSIEDNVEKFAALSDAEKTEVEAIINAANKTRNINIRISSTIHKYISGKLVDEKAVLKSMELLRR